MKLPTQIEGLIAKSLYEDLDLDEKRELESYLSEHPETKRELDELRAFTERIPKPETPLDSADVLANVRERLQARRAGPVAWRWAAIPVAAALAIAAGLALYGAYGGGVDAPPRATNNVARSAVAEALSDAEELIRERNVSGAYRLLVEAVRREPNDPQAGAASQRAADLAFEELKMYPAAHEHYAALRDRYSEAFQAELQRNRLRLELLAEAATRRDDYAALYALDAARSREDFEALENLIAQHTGTFLASLASTEMARLAAAGQEGNRVDSLAAMQMALNRCTNPRAAMQLKLEMGHLYREDVRDVGKARELYEEVTESGITVLAELAETNLKQISTP